MGMASGDLQALLGEWFRTWRMPLRRYLSRKGSGSAADIDDIAQEVFLRLLRYDRAELIERPQAYLFQVASNVSAEWAMRSSRRLPHHSEWLDDLVDTLSPESETERESVQKRLHAALDQLPARAREILRLHFADGMTHPEIAARLGVTRKIVKRDTARAYAMLRMTLDGDQLAQRNQP
jgi:RNA polymerase sigma factor (sigma-70 family)